jgi:hypothetical protein
LSLKRKNSSPVRRLRSSLKKRRERKRLTGRRTTMMNTAMNTGRKKKRRKMRMPRQMMEGRDSSGSRRPTWSSKTSTKGLALCYSE